MTTAILTKASAASQEIDTSSADQKSKQLFATTSTKVLEVLRGPSKITAERIAEIVRDIILNEKPNLRYQTNKKFNPNEIAAKLIEPTGNNLIDLIAKKYCEE